MRGLRGQYSYATAPFKTYADYNIFLFMSELLELAKKGHLPLNRITNIHAFQTAKDEARMLTLNHDRVVQNETLQFRE